VDVHESAWAATLRENINRKALQSRTILEVLQSIKQAVRRCIRVRATGHAGGASCGGEAAKV